MSHFSDIELFCAIMNMLFLFFPGEIDTRFSFCAIATLALLVWVHCIVFLQQLVLFKSIKVFHFLFLFFLKKLFFSTFKGKMDTINLDKAVEFVLSSMNFDGGFGCRPGSESHAGQVSY